MREYAGSLKYRGSTELDTASANDMVQRYVSAALPAFSPGHTASDACAKIETAFGTNVAYLRSGERGDNHGDERDQVNGF